MLLCWRVPVLAADPVGTESRHPDGFGHCQHSGKLAHWSSYGPCMPSSLSGTYTSSEHNYMEKDFPKAELVHGLNCRDRSAVFHTF